VLTLPASVRVFFAIDPIDMRGSFDAIAGRVRGHAKSRLNSLFAGSVEGAHRYATIAGVVASAQREGLDVLAYLTWAFERRGTHRRQFGMRAAELTPAAYKHTLEHGAQQAA
jgi:hypothetical protein